MTMRYDVLIVGGGHAGAQVAITLRHRGYPGSIAIVGAEPELPYERPPLSKEYLAGEKTFDRLLIRPEAFWREREVEMVLGRAVEKVDPAAHAVRLSDGSTLRYGVLVWAAGGAPRRLTCKGHDLAGVHAIRTRADVDHLAAELAAEPAVAIIGGGYIGLEAAAVLVKRGLRVTLLEAQDRVLARVAGDALSRFYEAAHRSEGVDLRTGVSVVGLEGATRVEGVRLGDGSVVPAGVVVVGVGLSPAVAPLRAAGAVGEDGVTIDRFCRTSLPDIYAVGDCAAHPNPFADGAVIRLESVQNAADQAATAARNILGDAVPYVSTPWFWSNQYDLKLQTIGLSSGHDAAIIRGDPSARSFSVAYCKAGRLIALDCVNAPKDFVQGRKLVTARVAAPASLLADPQVQLKAIPAPDEGAAPGLSENNTPAY